MREATSETLAAYAQGYTRLYGCVVPGSTSAPAVKVVFDCLAEQKKESQMGASQALLKVSSSSWCAARAAGTTAAGGQQLRLLGPATVVASNTLLSNASCFSILHHALLPQLRCRRCHPSWAPLTRSW